MRSRAVFLLCVGSMRALSMKVSMCLACVCAHRIGVHVPPELKTLSKRKSNITTLMCKESKAAPSRTLQDLATIPNSPRMDCKHPET